MALSINRARAPLGKPGGNCPAAIAALNRSISAAVAEATAAARRDPTSGKYCASGAAVQANKADEIADAALYLASADASFVTGAELVVDGGWTDVMP